MLLTACEAVPDEKLDCRLPGVSGIARELLIHIVGGQQTFVLRMKGRQHEGELIRGSAWPGWEALRSIATERLTRLLRPPQCSMRKRMSVAWGWRRLTWMAGYGPRQLAVAATKGNRSSVTH